VPPTSGPILRDDIQSCPAHSRRASRLGMVLCCAHERAVGDRPTIPHRPAQRNGRPNTKANKGGLTIKLTIALTHETQPASERDIAGLIGGGLSRHKVAARSIQHFPSKTRAGPQRACNTISTRSHKKSASTSLNVSVVVYAQTQHTPRNPLFH
jgi:hypothetical protein